MIVFDVTDFAIAAAAKAFTPRAPSVGSLEAKPLVFQRLYSRTASNVGASVMVTFRDKLPSPRMGDRPCPPPALPPQGKRMKVCDPMLGVVTERSWLPKPCFIPAKAETSEQIGDLSWRKIGFMR